MLMSPRPKIPWTKEPKMMRSLARTRDGGSARAAARAAVRTPDPTTRARLALCARSSTSYKSP